MILKTVVFPHPDGPMIDMNSFCPTEKVTSRRASVWRPCASKTLATESNSMHEELGEGACRIAASSMLGMTTERLATGPVLLGLRTATRGPERHFCRIVYTVPSNTTLSPKTQPGGVAVWQESGSEMGVVHHVSHKAGKPSPQINPFIICVRLSYQHFL